MRTKMIQTLLVVAFLMAPAILLARAAAAMDGTGMKMSGKTIMLPGQQQQGVKAMAHLIDTRAAMARAGQSATHHLMVMFTDAVSGKPLPAGVVAVKVTGPAGKTTGPVRMMAMDNGFGADVQLDQPGEYSFEVGTRLSDGKKRLFRFPYAVTRKQ